MSHYRATYKKRLSNIKNEHIYFFMSLSYTLHQQKKAPKLSPRAKMALTNLVNQKITDLKELSHVDAVGAPTTGEWLLIAKFIKENI